MRSLEEEKKKKKKKRKKKKDKKKKKKEEEEEEDICPAAEQEIQLRETSAAAIGFDTVLRLKTLEKRGRRR